MRKVSPMKYELMKRVGDEVGAAETSSFFRELERLSTESLSIIADQFAIVKTERVTETTALVPVNSEAHQAATANQDSYASDITY